MAEFLRRMYYLLNRKRLQSELENDMAAHREMLGENRKDFGNPAVLREQANSIWGWGWLERLLQDMRFGARMLRRSPSLAVTAILVLAIGIGVNVTAFNIIDVFFFKPLPVRDPHTLVRFTTQFPEGGSTEVAYPAAEFYAANSSAFSALIAQRWTNLTLSEKQTESLRAGVVSSNYFTELGAAASYGRLFLPQTDGQPDSPPVVILGQRFWQRHFGGDASVIGRTIHLNQRPATIIGITAYNFGGLDPEDSEQNDVWITVLEEPYFAPQSKVLTSFDDADSRIHMWARLQPGTTVKQAQQALLPLSQELVRQHPDILHQGEHLHALPGAYAGNLDASDVPVLGLVAALFLLILASACGNLGSLLMGHAATREREISIRLSLGATRMRILRQIMTENLLLALAGSAVGLFASWNVARVLVLWLGGPANFDFTPDWRVVSAAFAMGLLACLIFGLPSARQLSQQKTQTMRARNIFVATQIAASCVLLVLSSLLLRAMERAVGTDPGFNYRQTLTVDPALYAHGYKSSVAANYLQQAEARLQQIPGVECTALVRNPPLGHRASIQPIHAESNFKAYFNQVGPTFFRALDIPLLQGRIFNQNEHDVAVVSESFARKVWPGKDPLRQTHKLGNKQLTIVGVVGNARTIGFRDGNSVEMYLPLDDQQLTEAMILVKTTRRPEELSGTIAAVARSIDPVISPEIVLVKDSFKERVGMSGKITAAITAMGALALALAVVGLFGVVSYNVARRTREVGIRMALGATGSLVMRSILGRFLRPLLIALGAGTTLAVLASMVIRTELFGVSYLDPLSYASAILLLVATAALAAVIPARRALKVDPMVALRCE